MSFKSVSVLLAAIWVALSAIIMTANPNTLLPEATKQAGEVDFLFKFMLVGSAFIIAGPVIVPGNHAASYLWQAINGTMAVGARGCPWADRT